MKNLRRSWSWKVGWAVSSVALLSAIPSVVAQQLRVLGLDVSTYQGSISTTSWATLKRATNSQVGGVFGDGRDFVVIRSSRGGTTGEDHRQGGYPSGNNTFYDFSQRYDDPYYVQNINRATSAGLIAGTYHFARPDVIASTLNSDGTTTAGVANNGTDEANHMIQMASPWMRPGYLPPTLDLEAGDGIRTDNEMAQFCVDFSDHIYATTPTPAQVVSAIPTLWSARWPNQADPNSIDVQNTNPKDTYTPIYGPWDDSPNPTHPWKFWQYASTARLNGINNGASNVDVDAAQGGLEFVKDQLIPAIWVTNSSGQWTNLLNWNSGLPPQAPATGPGQLTPIGTQTLPTPRLPDINDTVVLDVTSGAVTVTLASGTHNIRKLYMRETLNITGGSLTINYVPSWNSTTNSAQFSGPVTLSGSASLNVHTLQVDNTRTFTLNGGTLAFNTLSLMPGATPAKLALGGDVSFNAIGGAVATITNGTGSGSFGYIDLGSATRAFNVASGVDLLVAVPISNGGLSKTGLGTIRLNSNNTYSGATTIAAGTLLLGSGGSFPNTPGITLSNAATLNVSAKAAGFVLAAAQTLAGNGSVVGRVTASGTVSPGASVGKLTFSTNLTLAGTAVMEVSHNGSVVTNDAIACSNGTLTYGGSLVVSNVGPALTGGELFTIFVAPTYAGAFAATTLPALNAGLNWHLGGLVSNGAIKVNRSPVSGPATVTNTPALQVQIPIASLIAAATDADGDAINLAGINLITTNGITLLTNGAFITYSNTVNVADLFTYTISDGHGGSVTGAVTIAPAPATPPAQFTAPPDVNNNSVTLHFAGGPGSTYYLERSTNLPLWLTILTNVMPGNGLLDYTDDFHDLTEPPPSAFYRLRWSP